MIDVSRRNFLAGSGASLFAGAIAPSTSAAAQPHSSINPGTTGARQNIICFMPDTLRADALGCYGNPIAKTPNFDKLAAMGTLFEDCHVQFPICGASRCSMLTGWPVSVRGHRSQMYYLRPEEPNLFRYLRQAGYDVFWGGKNDVLAQRTFDDSVSSWNLAARQGGAERPGPSRPGQAGAVNSGRPPGPLTFIGSGKPNDRRNSADYHAIQGAIEILERRETDRPFLLFLPLDAPHPPYNSPEGFAGLHAPSDVYDLIPTGLRNRPSHLERMLKSAGLDTVSPAAYRTIRAAYLDKVSSVDWLLGELLEAVERTNHTRNTSIFVLSDHGDYAGDFGLVEKWPSGMESCLTHVPMIAHVPGAKGAHRVAEPIELFDFMATAMELAHTSASHTHFARSLMPQINGAAGDPHRGAFTEGGYNTYEPQCFEPVPPESNWYHTRLKLQVSEPQTCSRVAAVRTAEYTFVSRPQGVSELYLRKTDPRELNNRHGDSAIANVQRQAEERLLHWYLNTSGIAPWDRDPREFPAAIAQPGFPDKKPDRILDLG